MHTLQKSGYLCHEQQMYTLRRVTISEGKAKNTSVIEVQTAGGLQLDILPDAGLDIGQVRYKGTNVTFISKNGYDSDRGGDAIRLHPDGLLRWNEDRRYRAYRREKYLGIPSHKD